MNKHDFCNPVIPIVTYHHWCTKPEPSVENLYLFWCNLDVFYSLGEFDVVFSNFFDF